MADEVSRKDAEAQRGRGRLPVTGYLCFTSPPTHFARRCRA